MRNFLTAILLACLVFSGATASACTGIYASDGKTALAGNNEDFWLSNTKMWFVPGEGGTYGRVYFGFEDMNPQGGMNEKGLFYDGFATQRCEVKSSLRKERYRGNIADDAMARCATVEEVIELFSRYNLQFLENAMLFFGDANGDSVIIEGDAFVRKQGRYQICTNFYQSLTKPEEIACGRFKIATRMFEESVDISVDLFRRILAAAHVELFSPTQYSNVYDLKKQGRLPLSLPQLRERGDDRPHGGARQGRPHLGPARPFSRNLRRQVLPEVAGRRHGEEARRAARRDRRSENA